MEFSKGTAPRLHRTHNGLPIFAVVSCVRSIATSGSAHSSLLNTSLFKTLIPSIGRTVTMEERKRWSVWLYLCADDDDALYLHNTAAVSARAPSWLTVRLLFFPRVPNRVPSREAAQQAYVDGAEYLHRTNDDILYLTPGWITSSTSMLARFNPPNVGIVGPKVFGDGTVNKMHGGITIDVVHRTHLRIFREYYPPQLDNWFTDSWIVYAYVALPVASRSDSGLSQAKRVARMSRLDNFSVSHKFEKRRYSPTKSQAKYLAALVECSRFAIWAYLNHTQSGTRYGRPVSCRAYFTMTDMTDGWSGIVGGAARSTCSRRVGLVGGLEMNEKDLTKSADVVKGWCMLRANYSGGQAGQGSPHTGTNWMHAAYTARQAHGPTGRLHTTPATRAASRGGSP